MTPEQLEGLLESCDLSTRAALRALLARIAALEAAGAQTPAAGAQTP